MWQPAQKARSQNARNQNEALLASDLLISDLLAGGGGRDRTDDLLLAKQALSRLSYAPDQLVGQGGFEPPTSRLSSARSNQLSY